MDRQEPDFSRFAFFFDDPPISDNTRGLGLSPINTRISASLRPALTVYNTSRLWSGQVLYINPASTLVEILGGKSRTVVNWASKLGESARSFLESRFIRLNHLPAADRVDWVFAPIGADVSSLRRAVAVKKELGSRLIAYLVDDPLDAIGASGTDRQSVRQQREFTEILRQVDVVCTITEQLALLMTQRHGAPATHLPLPYVRDDLIRRRQVKNQIVYVGSVNQIYRAELEYWIDLLRKSGFFENGRLLVTGDYQESPGISVRHFSSKSDLNQELIDSIACLLPVSSRDSDLCFTSFPSKTLDYLAYSPLILASAPEGSIVDQFFHRNSIPQFYLEGEVDPLKVMELLSGKQDHRAAYHDVLDRTFSLDAFAERIIELSSAHGN